MQVLIITIHLFFPSKRKICSIFNNSVPEDTSSSSQQSGALRAKKIRVWVRRLRSGDKYESKHSSKASNNVGDGKDKDSNGRKEKHFGEVDWIRCSNPHCGKWRACLRSSNGQKIRNDNKVTSIASYAV